jgi:hypothetical protein
MPKGGKKGLKLGHQTYKPQPRTLKRSADELQLPLEERKKKEVWQGRIEAEKAEREHRRLKKELSLSKTRPSDLAAEERAEQQRQDDLEYKREVKLTKKHKKAHTREAKKAYKLGLPPPPPLEHFMAELRRKEEEREQQRQQEKEEAEREEGVALAAAKKRNLVTIVKGTDGFGLEVGEGMLITKARSEEHAFLVGSRIERVNATSVANLPQLMRMLRTLPVGASAELALGKIP